MHFQFAGGKITRQRKTSISNEEAILDLFIVCEKVLPLIKYMEVDEKGEYGLTNFKGIKNGMKVTSSDHNATILRLDLSF